MSRNGTADAQLLLQCVRPTPDVATLRRLCNDVDDWTELAVWAGHLRVGPMVLAALRDASLLEAVPDAARAELARQNEESLEVWNRQMERFGDLVDGLAANGVVPTLLKGAGLVPTVYAAPELRTMSDIDLLTTKAELAVVERVLYERGFEPGEWCDDPAWFIEHHHHLVPFMSTDEKLTVEVHHSIMPPWSFDVPTAGLLERARPVELAGRPTRALAPEDQLLHVCLHLALEFTAGLRSLADIARIVELQSTDLSWSRLVEAARTCGGHRHVRAILLAAQDLLEVDIPEDVLDELARGDEQSGLEATIAAWLIPRTILHRPGHDPLPSWLLASWCQTVLSRDPTWRKAQKATTRIADGYLDSIRNRADENGRPIWLTALLHPAWMIMRRLGLTS